MELNPFSHEFHADPYPTYRRLRDEAPCYFNAELDFFAVSRYEDVLAASQQPLLYSSAEGTILERLDTRALLPMMIFMDPPRHDLHRQLVSRAFTPRAVAELEPFVRSTAVELLEALGDNGGGDFVEEFSAILPMNVIMELLGVPQPDRDQLRHWMDATLERNEEPPYVPDTAVQAMISTTSYWRELLREKRSSPDSGLMSRLCEAEIETEDGPARLTDEEVIGFCSLIGSAGTETLTKLLANAAVLLQRNPSEWNKILDDPTALPGAVEETLRYWAPSQYQGRLLTRDVTLHGVTMPEGSRVLMLTGSANRDEREYEEPDRFDISRGAHVPLGFGYGVHFCLGAALARLEGRVGLGEFARLFPEYEIDETGLERVHQSNVHGFSRVPVAAKLALR
ncbi:MAG TPA: cytochrome P450 [Acidimicrobiales bacterium]|nr:cytochrome P450 [Acidimicrobiales bacterium]